MQRVQESRPRGPLRDAMRLFDWLQLAINLGFVCLWAFQWGINRSIARSLVHARRMSAVASGMIVHEHLKRYGTEGLEPFKDHLERIYQDEKEEEPPEG